MSRPQSTYGSVSGPDEFGPKYIRNILLYWFVYDFFVLHCLELCDIPKSLRNSNPTIDIKYKVQT